MKIDGGCHCGYITYTAEIDPNKVGICHCTDCQTLSGSAFRTSVRAAKDAFNLRSGQPKIYIKTAESGNKRAQAFCPECGTPIYAADVTDPQSFNIRVGTIRQRAELRPKSQGWCRSARDWVMDLGSIRQFEKQRTS
ncbi:MAG TPA: GFA family protein [Candidatus Acidoferrales bacterium]|nr:GFA family protein [Candidatus Acidoferrales bacterium]